MKNFILLSAVLFSSFVYSQTKTVIISPVSEPLNSEEEANRLVCIPFKETGPGGCCIRWSVACSNGYTWYGQSICDFGCQIQHALEDFKVLGGNGNQPTKDNQKSAKIRFDISVLESNFTSDEPIKKVMEYKSFKKFSAFNLDKEDVIVVGGVTYVFMPGLYVFRNEMLNVNYYVTDK